MRRTVLSLVLTTLLTACAQRAGTTPEDAITMDHNVFATEALNIPVGGRITFSNSSSRALHILVVGRDAQPRPEPGSASFGGASGHRADVGDMWTTPPWTTPGTYHVTCTLHPSMNLVVVVG